MGGKKIPYTVFVYVRMLPEREKAWSFDRNRRRGGQVEPAILGIGSGLERVVEVGRFSHILRRVSSQPARCQSVPFPLEKCLNIRRRILVALRRPCTAPHSFLDIYLFFSGRAIKLVDEPNITASKFQKPVGISAEQFVRS